MGTPQAGSAGKTLGYVLSSAPQWSIPVAVCGEQRRSKYPAPVASAFSPACAGNRYRPRTLTREAAVQPRVCGEQDGGIVINRGEPWQGRDRVAQMAAGFFSDVPDIKIVCDGLRCAGDHVVYLWTFTGTHAGTKRPLRVSGWEEWDLDADYKVKASRGWYDADDYARQTGG